jgi:hypothetical protein
MIKAKHKQHLWYKNKRSLALLRKAGSYGVYLLQSQPHLHMIWSLKLTRKYVYMDIDFWVQLTEARLHMLTFIWRLILFVDFEYKERISRELLMSFPFRRAHGLVCSLPLECSRVLTTILGC